jgi:hypothetical protein
MKEAAYLEVPLQLVGYPACFDNLMLEFDVLHAAILVSDLLPVLVNISGFGVELGPLMIRLES